MVHEVAMATLGRRARCHAVPHVRSFLFGEEASVVVGKHAVVPSLTAVMGELKNNFLDGMK